MSEDEKKDRLHKNFVKDMTPHKDKINKMPKELFLHVMKGGKIH